MTKEWLLMKRGLYILDAGVSAIVGAVEAGRYSYAEVEESVKACNGVTGIHEPGAPDFTTAKYPNAIVTEDAREAVLEIQRCIKGAGPGRAASIQLRPGQWQALLDAIPGPGEPPTKRECD